MSQRIRHPMVPVLEVDDAMAQAATMGAVDVQHTTTASQKQHKSRSVKLVTVQVSKHKEKVRIKGRPVRNKVS